MDKNETPPPIIRQKAYEQSSVFIPENLLRGDFEKGEEEGSRDALQLVAITANAWSSADFHE